MHGQGGIDVRESLSCLGYPKQAENWIEDVTTDLKKFSVVVAWLSNELSYATQGSVDRVTSLEDAGDEESFNLEVSSLLTALRCPYGSLVSGDVKQRLESKESKLTLLAFLASEVQAARMIKKTADVKRMRREQSGSPQSRNALLLLKSVGLPIPRRKIDLDSFFEGLRERIKTLQPEPHEQLFTEKLTPAQWSRFDRVYKKLLQDFTIRRMALLKRLDVTIQSFGWSSRMKDKQDQITQVFMPCRQSLLVEPSVQLGDVLAARQDVLIVDKTSCLGVREKTQTSIAKVMMGSVPDRGGRAAEMAPPPPEMPSWSKRQAPSSGNQGPRGRGGAGRGGQGGAAGRGGQGGRRGLESNYGQAHNRGRDSGHHQAGSRDGYYQGGGDDYYRRDSQYQGNGGYYREDRGGGYYDDGRNRRDSRQQQHGEYNTGRVADAGWQEHRHDGQRGGYRGSYRGGRGHNQGY
ncbi:protein FAM98A [Galendromus occidentalis]|uniref:Protein FAM98A n=1 Tax=Galendromus occidentalis TaxID=34638 RepID=A0AAJ6VWZ0_9ACAR|nr:protein FAM98A [Galendromus occidentalis]